MQREARASVVLTVYIVHIQGHAAARAWTQSYTLYMSATSVRTFGTVGRIANMTPNAVAAFLEHLPLTTA